jgi:hypothetical protein
MAARYISVTDPSTTAFVLGSGSTTNVHDGTSSTAADLLEVRWDSTISKKMVYAGLEVIKRWIEQGGGTTKGGSGQDSNVPV